MSELAFQEQLGRLTAPRSAASGTPLTARSTRSTSPKSFCLLAVPMPTTYHPLFSAPLSSALRARTKRSCISRGAPPRASLTHPRPHFTTKFVFGLHDNWGKARRGVACRVLAAHPAFCSLPCLGSLIQKLHLCCHSTWQHRNSVPRLSQNPAQVSPPVTL